MITAEHPKDAFSTHEVKTIRCRRGIPGLAKEKGGGFVEEKKEQPRCNCGEVKIIPLDEEEE